MATVECCVDSLTSARRAQDAGAHRVEVCTGLLEGGLTPSHGLLSQLRAHLHIPCMVLIRPRAGDFCYSDDEFEQMLLDIAHVKHLQLYGIVIGVLTPDGRIDLPRMQRVMAAAAPLVVTFHRAIDVCRDMLEAVDTCIELGIQRILTSGGKASALEGKDVIQVRSADSVRSGWSAACVLLLIGARNE